MFLAGKKGCFFPPHRLQLEKSAEADARHIVRDTRGVRGAGAGLEKNATRVTRRELWVRSSMRARSFPNTYKIVLRVCEFGGVNSRKGKGKGSPRKTRGAQRKTAEESPGDKCAESHRNSLRPE